MIDGNKVGKELKEAHRAIYGNSAVNNVFAGGNVGTSFLGLCMQEGAKMIAESVKALASAIEKRPPSVTNNYYPKFDAPKETKRSTYRGKKL